MLLVSVFCVFCLYPIKTALCLMMSRRRGGNTTAFPSSCLSLFGISLPGACIVLWEHVKHQKALSPDIPTLVPDTKHCEVPKVLGAPNQHSATSHLKLSKQASASAGPLGFFFFFSPCCFAWALGHSRSHSAVTLRHIGTRPDANHAPEDICVVANTQAEISSDELYRRAIRHVKLCKRKSCLSL